MAVRLDPPRRFSGVGDYCYRYLVEVVRQIEYELNDRDRVIEELKSKMDSLTTELSDLNAKINESSAETTGGEEA